MTTLMQALDAIPALRGRVFSSEPADAPDGAYVVVEQGSEAVSMPLFEDGEGRQVDQLQRFITAYLYHPGDPTRPDETEAAAAQLSNTISNAVDVVDDHADVFFNSIRRGSGGLPPTFRPLISRWYATHPFVLVHWRISGELP